MMKLSQEQREQIVGHIRSGNLTAATESCRELMKGDASAAETLIHELQSEISETSGSGKTWTLLAGLTVLVAILATVYVYVFPRLAGERVSPTARIEVRQVSAEPQDGWVKMPRTDGTLCYVAADVRLSAVDFSVFRGDGLQVPPTLTLYFSDTGIVRSAPLRDDHSLILGVVLPNKVVAMTDVESWGADRMILPLAGVSAADANEIFARLTN